MHWISYGPAPGCCATPIGWNGPTKKRGGGGSILPLFLLFLFVDGKREGEKERERESESSEITPYASHIRVLL